jgi:nucleoid DNA-binding protein
MAAQALTASQFVEDIATRLEGEYSKADVRRVLVAVAEELQGALADGYKVSIAGVGRFEPRAKAGRKKGDLIRNPFDPDAPPKKVTADEPTKVVVKAFPAAALKNGMPGAKTKKGQELAKTLLAKK